MKKVIVLVSLLIVYSLISCDTDHRYDIEGTDLGEQEPVDNKISSIKPTFELLFKLSPSPCEIPFLLESTRVKFDPLLVQSIEKTERLETSELKLALNLGICSTDFGYLASFGRTDAASLYLDYCKVLSDQLNITSAFDLELVEEMEENIDSPDILSRIIKKEVRSISTYLRSDYRTGPAVLVLTGGVIEGLYLSTELLINSYDDPDLPEDCIPEILQLIRDQGYSLHGVLSMLDKLDQTEEVITLTRDVTDISILIEKLEVVDRDLSRNNSWIEYANKIRSIRSSNISELEVI